MSRAVGPPSAARRSASWAALFRIAYRLLRLGSPIVGWAVRLGAFPSFVRLTVVGRRTGRPRSTWVTLLLADGRWYVGHPNGRAGWALNLAAAGSGTVAHGGGRATPVRAFLLPDRPERDRAIAAALEQQPWPANWLYRAARHHVAAVGVYFRLEPTGRPTDAADS